MTDKTTQPTTKRSATGRRPKQGPTYTVHVQLRLTPEQAKVYQSIGQTEWLRKMLDHVGDVADRWGIDLESLAPTPETIPEKTATPEGCLKVGLPADRVSFITAASLLMNDQTDVVTPNCDGTETISLMHRIAQNRRDLFAFEVEDDAMAEDGVFRGDLVLVERGQVANDGLCLAKVNGKLYLRKLSRRGLSQELRAANASGDYPTMRVNLSNAEILGPVTCVVRTMKK